MLIIILNIIAALLLFYIILSWIIYRQTTNGFYERLDFVQEDIATLLTRNSERFNNHHQEMLALGFQAAEALSTNAYDHIHSEMIAYRHPDYPVIGMVTCITNTVQMPIDAIEYAEFSEHFEGEAELITCNAQTANPFSAKPPIYYLQFPAQQNVAALWNIHKQISQYFQQTHRAIDVQYKNIAELMNADLKKQALALQKDKFIQPANADGGCRLTYWGAFNTTWRNIPFLNEQLLHYRCRQSNKLLNQARQSQKEQ